MEPAAQRMNLLDSGDFLRPPHRIDNPSMTAGGDHHQPPVTNPETRRMHMPMLVRHRRSREFLIGKVMIIAILDRIATDAIFFQNVQQAAFHPANEHGIFWLMDEARRTEFL